MTEDAAGKTVKVTLTYAGETVSYVTEADVTANDVTGSRGTEKTDNNGAAIFDATTTITNDEGKGTVTDDAGNVITVTVSICETKDGEYAGLADAVVTQENDAYSVALPTAATGKFVKVMLAYADESGYVKDGTEVSAADEDATDRGTLKTEDGAVLFAVYTVTFNAKDGEFADGEKTTTQSVYAGKYASAPTTDPTYEGYEFDGWYTSTDGGTTLSDTAYDFENNAVTADITLYAKWTAASTESAYFLAKAGLDNATLTKLAAGDTTATADTANLFVSQSKIEEGIAALSGSDATAKATATTTWTNYMNSDTGTATDNTVHLYTAWKGTDASDDADKWVEFRIVQVGEHDGDGSNVTFMAVHSLPTAQQMNSTYTNANGWEGSTLRTSTMNSYVKAGLTDGFIDALKAVTKENYSVENTKDSIWLMSYSELTGTTAADAGDEGSQYTWFSDKVTNPTNSNQAIANLNKTRAGSNPRLMSDDGAWLRSPCKSYNKGTLGVIDDGDPTASYAETNHAGVCIALSM